VSQSTEQLLRIEQVATDTSLACTVSIELPFDRRVVSRQRVMLSDGREAGLFLPRGSLLRGGDVVLAVDGTAIKINAAQEAVLQVTAIEPLALTRAAYHLGNRHVPVEVGPNYLRLEYDYVLKQMLEGLGVQVTEAMAPFEPEGGAYGGYAGHGGEHRH
jgi:urease accessory protein